MSANVFFCLTLLKNPARNRRHETLEPKAKRWRIILALTRLCANQNLRKASPKIVLQQPWLGHDMFDCTAFRLECP